MPTILYPVLTEPVLPPALQPETVTESRWHQPLSIPVLRIGLTAALIASSGALWAPFAPAAAEVITADKWVQPLSVPVRRPYAPPGHIALVEAAPFPETVTADRWFQPLSGPVRRPYAPPGHIAAPILPPTIFADRWFQPFSIPTRLPVAAGGYIVAPIVVTVAPTSSVDSWFQALSLPTRRAYAPPGHIGFVQAAPFGETVTLGWSQPLPGPVLRTGPSAALMASSGEKQAPFVAPTPPVTVALEWMQPLSLPTYRGSMTALTVEPIGPPSIDTLPKYVGFHVNLGKMMGRGVG